MELLRIVIWPCAFLIAFTLFITIFRAPISERIESARRLRFGKLLLEGEIPQNKRALTPSNDFSASKWRLDRVANIYWLGHDLMWTLAITTIGTPNSIEHGLKQSLHHSRELSLPDYFKYQLDHLMKNHRSMKRDEVSREVGTLTTQVGQLLASKQGAFQASPRQQ
jgi:hypothetical protein